MKQYFLSIRAFCIGVLAVPLLVASCGGSNSSKAGGEITVETGSLSKPEFVERADAICRKSKARALREFQAFMAENQATSQTSPREGETTTAEVVDGVLIPIYGKLIDDFIALGAPKGDEQEVAAFLNTVQRALDRLKEDPAMLNTLRNPFTPASKSAGKYGLTGCANSLA
jgi:hypothetical protein